VDEVVRAPYPLPWPSWTSPRCFIRCDITSSTALRGAGVDEELRMALFGHGWRRSTTTRGYGIKDMVLRFTGRALTDAVASVSYPGLFDTPEAVIRLVRA
jgi:hypothetical protein